MDHNSTHQVRLPLFRERFKELREKHSQDEFGQMIGVSRPTVGFYEAGTRIPDAITLTRIASACDVSVDWLLGLSDVKSIDANARSAEAFTGLSEAALATLSTEKEAPSDAGLQRNIQFSLNDYRQIVSELLEAPGFSFLCEEIKCYKILYRTMLEWENQSPHTLEEDYSQAVTDDLLDIGITGIPIRTFCDYYKKRLETLFSYVLLPIEESVIKEFKSDTNDNRGEMSDVQEE